jgi:hypothetical protein
MILLDEELDAIGRSLCLCLEGDTLSAGRSPGPDNMVTGPLVLNCVFRLCGSFDCLAWRSK